MGRTIQTVECYRCCDCGDILENLSEDCSCYLNKESKKCQ